MANLTPTQLGTLRDHAARTEDCDLSRLCSAALWGTPTQRGYARRRIRECYWPVVASVCGGVA